MAEQIHQLGLIAYQSAHALQMELLTMWKNKTGQDVFLILQHTPVLTLGRHANAGNIMVSRGFLERHGVELVKVERGGEVTYHGPGQIICYPVINLRDRRLSVGEYVSRLEQVMLDVVADFGISSSRNSKNHGIWLGKQKLGSVGIAVRHGISYHGLALNVNPDLEPFSWINPCGMSDVTMTSMEEITRERIQVEDIESSMIHHINRVFS